MELLEFIGNLFSSLSNYQPYEKPRRVFTRGFVAFCVMVVVLELMTLSHFYGQPGWCLGLCRET